MKKFSVVLLIAVLAASLVFAADPKFTGNATIETKFNLDDLSFNTTNKTAPKVTLTFDFGSGKPSKAGEGDIYAEIAGEFGLKLNFDSSKSSAADKAKFSLTAKITKANIVVKDIVVIDILGVKSSVGFAKDFDTDDDGKEIDNLKLSMPTIAGVTVTVPKLYGVKIGFGWNAGIEAKTYNVGGSLQLNSFKVMEDALKIDLAGYGWLSNVTNKKIGAAAKVAYSADKFDAYAAVDAEYAQKNLDLEARLHGCYDIVSLDAYYWKKSNVNELSFNASADIAENVSAWVTAYSLLKAGPQLIAAGVEVKNIADVLDVTAELGYLALDIGYKIEGIAIPKKTLIPTLEVAYKNEMFTAKAGVVAALLIDGSFKISVLAPEASIESTKIVDNATIKLAYDNAMFFTSARTAGSVSLSAKVAF